MKLTRSSHHRTGRLGIALLAVALAVAGLATAALAGSGNRAGQWATPDAVQAALLSHVLDIDVCSGGTCKLSRPPLADWHAGEGTRVVSATVTGIAPFRLINGAPRYQLFNVRACTIYYYQGAHRYGVHFRWYTRRPPSTTKITTDDGRSVGPDHGEPYARDWNHPLLAPLARNRC